MKKNKHSYNKRNKSNSKEKSRHSPTKNNKISLLNTKMIIVSILGISLIIGATYSFYKKSNIITTNQGTLINTSEVKDEKYMNLNYSNVIKDLDKLGISFEKTINRDKPYSTYIVSDDAIIIEGDNDKLSNIELRISTEKDDFSDIQKKSLKQLSDNVFNNNFDLTKYLTLIKDSKDSDFSETKEVDDMKIQVYYFSGVKTLCFKIVAK